MARRKYTPPAMTRTVASGRKRKLSENTFPLPSLSSFSSVKPLSSGSLTRSPRGGRKRPTLPSQASPTARAAVSKPRASMRKNTNSAISKPKRSAFRRRQKP